MCTLPFVSQLIPISAKNANGIDYEIMVSKGSVSSTADPQQLLGVDVRGVIRPNLQEMKAAVVERYHQAREEVLRVLEEQAKTEEDLAEVEEEV